MSKNEHNGTGGLPLQRGNRLYSSESDVIRR